MQVTVILICKIINMNMRICFLQSFKKIDYIGRVFEQFVYQNFDLYTS